MRVLLLLFLLLPWPGLAQPDSLLPVPGVPSREVFDLLQDRKGFLWLGHNDGISRYDGQRFLSFTNPKQNGRAMTDLCEDRQGRIWCHNFEGQIFYLEGGKLKLLEAFDYRKEPTFPRIGIYGDELVATCVRGFFTYHIRTGETHYYDLPQAATSIAVLPGGVLLFLPHIGFMYYTGHGAPVKLQSAFHHSFIFDNVLQPHTLNDTAFFVSNNIGSCYRFYVRNDSLHATLEEQAGERINTVSVDGESFWVHTKSVSHNSAGEHVTGMDLSDVLTDNRGNRFYSSLRRGLLVSYQAPAKAKQPAFLRPGDKITKILPTAGGMLYGTESGELVLVAGGQVKLRVRSAPILRAITQMAVLNDSKVLVAPGTGLLRLDLNSGQLELIDSVLTVKDLAMQKDRVAVATTYGCFSHELSYFLSAAPALHQIPHHPMPRCRTAWVSKEGVYYGAFISGTFTWRTGEAAKPLLYKGAPVFTTRIRSFAGRLLFSTFNRGLLYLDGDSLQPALPANSLLRPIPRMLVTPHHLWLLYEKQVEEVDTHFRPRVLTDLPFAGADVTDLLENGDTLLVATRDGLFSLPAGKPLAPGSHTFIDVVLVNNTRNIVGVDAPLAHNENNLTLQLATPLFEKNGGLRYRYRLCSNDGACNWLLAEEEQTSFSFINLPPGAYTFSAVAVNAIGTALAPEVTFTFRIHPPWWGTWWAQLIFLVALTALFFFLGLYLQRRRARRQRVRYEKMLAVEHERQRISAEIHDDLGATLSGVRLLAELAREKVAPGPLRVDLEKIHQSITSLTEKTREVIWTLNTDQDSVESLLLYIQKSAQHLFDASPIHLQVHLPVEIPRLRIGGEIRRHVYLAVKEALHNCLKHSGATWCRLEMQCSPDQLHIRVQDNGRGMPAGMGKEAQPFSSGMRTMQQRMEQAGGRLELSSGSGGTQVQFHIPLEKINS